MEEKIYKILEDIRPNCNYRESTDYIEDGFLDSFDVIELVSKIEEVFDVKIDGLDILPENFKGISEIMDIIKKSGE